MTSYLRMLTKLPKIVKLTIFLVLCIPSLLFRCGAIEKNSGTKYSPLAFCHWNLNLNDLTVHDSSKISLFQAYVIQHNYDIICLSETFLNSSRSDTRISIVVYNLIRSDHPSNSKRGGVCIYYNLQASQ